MNAFTRRKKQVKLLGIFLFFQLLSCVGFAQGANLKYGQVITQSGTVSVPYGGTSTFTITVPTGKVWKIEAATVWGDAMMKINEMVAVYFRPNSAFEANYCPIWLKAGTYTISISAYPGGCCGATTVSYGYSGIEFIEVP
jgi:hypothetical protein